MALLVIADVGRRIHVIGQTRKEAGLGVKCSLPLQVLNPVLQLHHLTDRCLEHLRGSLRARVVLPLRCGSLMLGHGNWEGLLVQILSDGDFTEAGVELETPLNGLAGHDDIAGAAIGEKSFLQVPWLFVLRLAIIFTLE